MARISHDQNFKNLILDYRHDAIRFFAPEEAGLLDSSVLIEPIRQEQLKDRLAVGFRELDVPLLATWPDGRREAIIFALEEESRSSRFSIHRLIHYCVDLSDLFETTRVVPVVVFLKGGRNVAKHLDLGGDHFVTLRFSYIRSVLSTMDARAWWDSDNLVACLNLPNMRWPKENKVAVYARAVQRLKDLEDSPNRRGKYIDFIDFYCPLADNEKLLFEQQYPEEHMTTVLNSERHFQRGEQVGLKKGMEQGDARTLKRLLARKFGSLTPAQLERIDQADGEQVETWLDRVLEVNSLNSVFGEA